MNIGSKKLKSSYEPDARLELAHENMVPSRERLAARLDAFKNRLLKRHLNDAPTMAYRASLRRAANEAAALVWLTPYPLLLLPALMEEKARLVCEQLARQKQIRVRSQEMIEELV
jgi:hypothetical protein